MISWINLTNTFSKFLGFFPGSETCVLGKSLQWGSSKNKWESFAEDELQNYLKSVDPEKASAETKSLLKIANSTDEVVLLYTKTINGELCAKVISRYLKSNKWSNIALRELPLEENEAQF